MTRRMVIASLAAGGAIALAAAMAWPDSRMISRDIGCASVEAGRGREICQALSDSMQWTWMGHAIISPGWRVTWDSLLRVYCREHIGPPDIPTLKSMAFAADWRLQDGAQNLIRLVDGTNEAETSIFNPRNPDYLLKSGCRDFR
jgi:hypothetical protein